MQLGNEHSLVSINISTITYYLLLYLFFQLKKIRACTKYYSG